MHLRSDSAAGVRFLASIREGRGLKPSARAAGVGKETGYRWLRESFVVLRDRGLSVAEAQVELGYFSPMVSRWDEQRAAGGTGGVTIWPWMPASRTPSGSCSMVGRISRSLVGLRASAVRLPTGGGSDDSWPFAMRELRPGSRPAGCECHRTGHRCGKPNAARHARSPAKSGQLRTAALCAARRTTSSFCSSLAIGRRWSNARSGTGS